MELCIISTNDRSHTVLPIKVHYKLKLDLGFFSILCLFHHDRNILLCYKVQGGGKANDGLDMFELNLAQLETKTPLVTDPGFK